MSHSQVDNPSRRVTEDVEGYAVGVSGPKPAKMYDAGSIRRNHLIPQKYRREQART